MIDTNERLDGDEGEKLTPDGEDPEGRDQVRAVDLPTHLVERVEHRVARTEFETVDDYVAYVLEHVLARVAAERDGAEAAHEAVDREQVEERLESLGYLE